jgi:hypothetical protein
MPRWLKGQDTIHALLERGHLQQVAADSETAETLVTTSERHVQSAATLADSDPEAAFSLAYDAARKAATALLARQGLCSTTAGGHLVVVDAINAQFPGVAGLKSLDRYAVDGTKPSTPTPPATTRSPRTRRRRLSKPPVPRSAPRADSSTRHNFESSSAAPPAWMPSLLSPAAPAGFEKAERLPAVGGSRAAGGSRADL